MPPAALPHPEPRLEVACDESGSEGEKLVRGSTDTFAHASVDVTTVAALATIERVRVEARSPATEVKAGVVLRPQNRRVLEWLLGAEGPLLGRAHVHLTDKALHLTARMVALLEGGATGPGVEERAKDLHRWATDRAGREPWEGILADFNDLARARSLDQATVSAAALRGGLLRLGGTAADLAPSVPVDAEGLLALVARSRGGLDPIVPALADVLRHWGAAGRPLWVVHDVQATLTDAAIRAAVGASVNGSSELLEGISFVDSQHDPRVQLADFLAGAARRIASGALAGLADPGLVELVAPYVSDRSTWLEPWPAGAEARGGTVPVGAPGAPGLEQDADRDKG